MSGPSRTGPRLAPTTLYIFPHAGASVDFYVPFSQSFSTEIRRIAIQYPGRRVKHGLPDMASVPALADDIYQMMTAADQQTGGVAFFAHSMGALFAFEVAHLFESAGQPIAALFVSGSAAPSRRRIAPLPGSDHELLNAVTDVTGAKPEFVTDERFAATILPTLRSLKALTDYACPPGATVSCPIYAFLGESDETVSYEDVVAWSQHTTAEFAVRVFPGGHFYLNANLPELVGDIEAKISHLVKSE